MQAYLETIVCKFGGDPAICLGEEAICAKVYRQTDRRTDRQTTDASPLYKLILGMSLKHILEHCWGPQHTAMCGHGQD